MSGRRPDLLADIQNNVAIVHLSTRRGHGADGVTNCDGFAVFPQDLRDVEVALPKLLTSFFLRQVYNVRYVPREAGSIVYATDGNHHLIAARSKMPCSWPEHVAPASARVKMASIVLAFAWGKPRQLEVTFRVGVESERRTTALPVRPDAYLHPSDFLARAHPSTKEGGAERS